MFGINMKKVKTVLLFANGNIAAFNENEKQIPLLQMRSAIELFTEYASQVGFEVDGCEFRVGTGSGTIRGEIGNFYQEWK